MKPATSGDAGHDGGVMAEDSGIPDAGPEDAGPVDAGPGDAGCTGNFHQCGSTCAFNGSPLTCGTSCTPCPDVTNGTVSCDGTSCSFTCDVDGGYHACDGACIFEDGNSCGPTCMHCPTPDYAAPYCEMDSDGGATCSFSCDGDLVICGDGSCGHEFVGEQCGPDAGPCCTGECGTNGYCCAKTGSRSECNNDGDCQSFACPGVDTTNFQCGDAGSTGVCCVGAGGACTSNDDCCSGTCSNTAGFMRCKN